MNTYTKRICKIEGCNRPKQVRGMCFMHDWRLRNYGTIEKDGLRNKGLDKPWGVSYQDLKNEEIKEQLDLLDHLIKHGREHNGIEYCYVVR